MGSDVQDRPAPKIGAMASGQVLDVKISIIHEHSFRHSSIDKLMDVLQPRAQPRIPIFSQPLGVKGKTAGGNGLGLIQDLTEKSVGNRAKNDLCSAGTSPHVLETNANLALQPASNRRNPVVLEVDAPELSS